MIPAEPPIFSLLTSKRTVLPVINTGIEIETIVLGGISEGKV